MTAIYGIKNCDTMKKAFKWLNENNIDHTFHDYKKSGIDHSVIKQAISEHGWEAVINKRGTTWRKIPQSIQESMDEKKALDVANENPSIVKRPLLVQNGKTYLGFKAVQYKDIFNA